MYKYIFYKFVFKKDRSNSTGRKMFLERQVEKKIVKSIHFSQHSESKNGFADSQFT